MVLTHSAASIAPGFNSPEGNDLFKTVAGLSAVMMLSPVLAHAEPVARWGQTVYPAKTMPAPVLPAAPAIVPAAQDEPSGRSSRRHARARYGRHAVREAAADLPVEAKPAPTPAEAKPKDASAEPSSGPHEGPAPTIRDLVNRHARESGVPERLASAVVTIESRFNPKARGGHALGLMQIQYATARAAGFSGSAQGLFEPETNLRYGMKVLADAYKSSNGNVCLTLAKYQSGHLTTRVSASNRAYCARARALMAKA